MQTEPIKLPSLRQDRQPIQETDEATAPGRGFAVDPEHFRIALWNPAPPPVVKPSAPPPPKPRPQPIEAELLAITDQDNVRAAVIYDPKEDMIHVLNAGDSLRGYLVAAVHETSIDLTSENGEERLELLQPPMQEKRR